MLHFVNRDELHEYEWDYERKNWKRPPMEKDVLKKLSQGSSLIGGLRVLAIIILLVIFATVTFYFSSINLILMFISMYLYFGMFGFIIALAHELQHKTVFEKKHDKYSELLFYIVQTLVWNGPVYARISHKLHHRYTMVRGFDPETNWPEVITRRFIIKLMIRIFLQIMIIGGIVQLVNDIFKLSRRALGHKDYMMSKFCSEKEIASIRKESVAILLFHATLISIALVFGFQWILVFITLAWQVGSAIESIWHSTEHVGKEHNTNHQVLCTRSVKVSRFTKWIFFGLDDHIEHHLFPGVPSCNLSELHELLKDYQDQPLNFFKCWREMYSIAVKKDEDVYLENIPDVVFKELSIQNV